MRESNFSFPAQNRASVCITSALYDRRALDCTAILPLINSLTHLTYLTSTSPRIREILTVDGGLERLVRILKTTKANDKRSGWKWSMAFQCVANVGVRGSEAIRTRVVEAGMVPVIITVLDNFLKALDHVRVEKEQQQLLAAQLLSSQQPPIIPNTPSPAYPLHSTFGTLETGNASNIIQMSEDLEQPLTSYPHSPNATTPISSTYSNNSDNNRVLIDAGSHPSTNPQPATASTSRLLTAMNSNGVTPYEIRSSDDVRSDWGPVTTTEETSLTANVPQSPSASSGTTNTNITSTLRSSNSGNLSPSPTFDIDVLYREEDILLSLQLLAYLSKYPQLRATFHSSYPPHNVFSLVEKYTHRLHPPEIQYWAGVIMRNACRKDEARGGVRQCAYMACGKWETYAREFAKCRRCRKAKYCSKVCQSKAWSEGHRWWCMERHGHGESESSQLNNQPPTTAPATAVSVGHRSRAASYGHLTDNLVRSGANRETTGTPPTGNSSGTSNHTRGSGSGSSLLVS